MMRLKMKMMIPSYPFGHVHVYEFNPCLHVAPFLQGDDVHSLISYSQLIP